MIEVVVFEASVVSLHNDVKGMLVPGFSQVPSVQSYVRESVVPSSRSKTIPIYPIQLDRLQACTTESHYLPAI